MNYLALCQAVRSRIGIQGSGPDDVTTATDIGQDIVDAVSDAWNEIQLYREEWDWMRNSDSFQTSSGTTTYTTSTIFGASPRLKRYVPGSFYITDASGTKSQMRELDYDTFRHTHINEDTSGTPFYYTIVPWNMSVIVDKPDGIYTIELEYWKTPQELSANTDTPELPTRFHRLIVYSAAEKLSASIASQSTQMKFAQEYALGMGDLLRSQLPKKTITTRSIA